MRAELRVEEVPGPREAALGTTTQGPSPHHSGLLSELLLNSALRGRQSGLSKASTTSSPCFRVLPRLSCDGPGPSPHCSDRAGFFLLACPHPLQLLHCIDSTGILLTGPIISPPAQVQFSKQSGKHLSVDSLHQCIWGGASPLYPTHTHAQAGDPLYLRNSTTPTDCMRSLCPVAPMN